MIGLIVFGFVASVIIAILLGMLVPRFFPDFHGDDPRLLFISLLIIAPVSFLLGSSFTGYFSYYDIEDKWMLLWLPPVMYFNLLFVLVSTCMSLLSKFLSTFSYANNADNTGSSILAGFGFVITIGLYWYLMSLAGVGLGYFLRSRFVNWWYKDD
jgi:hypothetical protein